MTILDIDPKIRFRSQNFWLEGGSASGGAGLDGREQITFSENRRWIAKLDFAAFDNSSAGLIHALGDELRGRAARLRVPIRNVNTRIDTGDLAAFYALAGVSSQQQSNGHIKFSNGANFANGAGFALPSLGDPITREAAIAGASEIVIDGYVGRNLSVGGYLSINDFLYRASSNVDGRLRLNPPLREPVAIGAAVKISAPTVLMRLAEDDGFRSIVERGFMGKPFTVDLVEAFDR